MLTIEPPQRPAPRVAPSAPLLAPPAPSRARSLVPVVLAASVVAAGLAIDRSAVGIVIALFVLVVPFEKLFPRHRGQRLRRPLAMTDIAFALASPLMNIVAVSVAIVVGGLTFFWLPGLALRPLVGLLPTWSVPFIGIALFDLAIYWVHRWSHEVPLLWRFHAIHHSTEQLDWISGFRNHPFDGALIAPPFFFLLAAGFSAEFTGALAFVQIATGLFLHANVRWRLRPLHKVIITPEFHHWHHTNEAQAINTNYSVFLPVWDLMFGTYFMPKDRRPSVYGVSEPIPAGLWAMLWHPFRGMGNPLRFVRHPRTGLRAVWTLGCEIVRGIVRSTRRPTHRAAAAASR